MLGGFSAILSRGQAGRQSSRSSPVLSLRLIERLLACSLTSWQTCVSLRWSRAHALQRDRSAGHDPP
jgi:hypothetical protein